jgi:hypothetical protein
MSGILNKKERIIDFKITENGRSQMQNGDIRYRYASLSDKSILYTKDHKASLSNKADISNAEFNYLPLETRTKVLDEINQEFDLKNFYNKKFKDITENSILETEFNNAALEIMSNNSLGNNLERLNLLTTKNILEKNRKISFFDNGFLNIDFDFKNKVSKYETVKSLSESKKSLKTLIFDKRFSHKNNFLYLPPVTLQNNKLYEDNQFSNIENLDKENSISFLLTSFKNKIETEKDIEFTREKEVISILKSMKKSRSILKKVYLLENTSEKDSFIFELFELKQDQDSLEKLSFIKIGDFYDKKDKNTKKVYLIGKIINSREDEDDLDIISSFKDQNSINLKNKQVFTISAFYSFICLFTLVIE